MKRLFLILSILLIATTGFTQDKSFYKTWNVSPQGLVAHWNPSDPRAEATPQDLLDTTGNAVHLEQTTVTNQPVVTGTVNLSGLVDDYDGVDNFRVQEELADESTLTLLPDGPFMNLLDGSAAIQIPASVFTECVKASGPCVVNVFDSAGALIAGPGYPRVQDSALAFGPELNTAANATSPTNETNATTGWTNNGMATFESVSKGDEPEGTYSLHVVADSGTDGAYTSIATTIGSLHRMIFKYIITNGNADSKMGIRAGDAPDGIETFRVGDLLDTTWTTLTVDFIATANPTFFTWRENGSGDDADSYVDILSVKEVTNLGETAALIWDTPDGSGSQNWTGTGSGDPNDPLATLRVNKSDLNITGSQTWMALIKLDDGQPAANQYILTKTSAAGGNFRATQFYVDSDGKLSVFISADGGTSNRMFQIADAATFSDGVQSEFALVAATLDLSVPLITLCLNGVEIASSPTGSETSIFDTHARFVVGAHNEGTENRLAGEIADLPIWGRALSAAEVQNYWLSKGMRKLLGGL